MGKQIRIILTGNLRRDLPVMKALCQANRDHLESEFKKMENAMGIVRRYAQ